MVGAERPRVRRDARVRRLRRRRRGAGRLDAARRPGVRRALAHRRGAQQRHRRRQSRRRRHRRHGARARVFGRSRGLAVARAGALRAASGGAAMCRRRRSCWRRAPIGSAAAATTRRSTRRASRRCASRKRERTTRGSTACSDTPEGVDPAYLQRNARVNAAALASLALAPPAPTVVDESAGRPTHHARRDRATTRTCRGQPSPGATAYRIFWRTRLGRPTGSTSCMVGGRHRGRFCRACRLTMSSLAWRPGRARTRKPGDYAPTSCRRGRSAR